MRRTTTDLLLTGLMMILLCLISSCGDDTPTDLDNDDDDSNTGTIIVDTSPDSISATWSVTGPEGYIGSGSGDSTLNELDPGDYSVAWDEVASWVGPESESRTLSPNMTFTFRGIYSRPDCLSCHGDRDLLQELLPENRIRRIDNRGDG